MHTTLYDPIERIRTAWQGAIRPAVYADSVPASVEAAHLPGEPIPVEEALGLDYQPFAPGTWWGRPWSTTWFRVTATAQPVHQGRRTELLIDLGFNTGGPGFQAEGLAYATDGTVLKGIEPRTTYLPFAENTQAGHKLTVLVEAAANPRFTGVKPNFLGERGAEAPQPLYQFHDATLAVLEPEVFALDLDVQTLFELALALPETSERRHRLIRGLTEMLDRLDLHDVVGGAAAARERLGPFLASPAHASAPQVTAVGHAHIDSAWLWPVRETIRKCARTFSNVTALAQDYPDLRFACSSAQQYAWMKDHHPQVYARVKQAVADGKFVPVGGMWVESDTNMPGSEGLARQFTYGKRFFAEEFGLDTREVWLPDSFGYSGALPQICRLAGARWFLSQKMSWNRTNRFPHSTFWWEGIDGTRVFTHFPPSDTYSAQLRGDEVAMSAHNAAEQGYAAHSLLPFGYGDGGGGPTREMVELARRMRDLEGSPQVQIRTPAEFFADAEAEYPNAPVWVGEMYLEFHRGTYTTQIAMKQGNRRTEHLLFTAELWSAQAAVRGLLDYPYDDLDRLWRQTLLLQFHDILPGSSIAWVHREARETYAHMADELETIIDRTQRVLAGPASDTMITFNAAPHERDAVPAFGAGAPVSQGTVQAQRDGDDVIMSNGLVTIIVGADGNLASVRDNEAGREVLAGPGNQLHVHPDNPTTADAWNIDEFFRNRRIDLDDCDGVELDMSGAQPLVRVTRRHGRSTFVQTITLAPDAKRVDFTVDADWHAQDTLVKAAFDLALHADRSAAEIQYGHQFRSTTDNTSWDAAQWEICAHRWLHVGEPGYGAALINTGTYGHDVLRRPAGDARGAGSTMVRLTLLRSPLYPDPTTDQGEQHFAYSLLVGADIPDAVRTGYALALPPRTIEGSGPVEPLISVDNPDVVVTAVKLADDRSGDLVVRLYESRGGHATATVTATVAASTIGVVDLLERSDAEVASLAPLRDVEITAAATRATLDLGPFQVVTLRFATDAG